MKVAELKEGMLLMPAKGRCWGMANDTKLGYRRIYTFTSAFSDELADNSPAIYLGKTCLDSAVYGLRTYHKILFEGELFFTDGYEFHRGIEPL
jgi:hypothetical protein